MSNHGHVLVYLGKEPDARVRDIAEAVGITERAAQGILRDLVTAGYLTRSRVGRRNAYPLDRSAHLRHPEEDAASIGDLLGIFRG